MRITHKMRNVPFFAREVLTCGDSLEAVILGTKKKRRFRLFQYNPAL